MYGKPATRKFFTEQLLQWHRNDNDRTLPWKEEKDPYKIWLSEIILQQTRAAQGLPYFLRFVKAFPDIHALAAACDEEVFRLWQGLGYYSRCKNLLHTARFIVEKYQGEFPSRYEEILALKGVGNYTAAAIASFAFGQPYAVVDGNVIRVLARFFGIETAWDVPEGRKTFTALAEELLDKKEPAAYNQAIMDHGATVCTPQAPRCDSCPLQSKCFAFRHNLISELPQKAKKLVVKTRNFHYILLLTKDDRIWIRKRTEKDIWQNLFEPLLIEHNTALNVDSLRTQLPQTLSFAAENLRYEGSLRQRLTHQLIETNFFSLPLLSAPREILGGGQWVPLKDLKNFAFPKTLVSFLEKKFYF